VPFGIHELPTLPGDSCFKGQATGTVNVSRWGRTRLQGERPDAMQRWCGGLHRVQDSNRHLPCQRM